MPKSVCPKYKVQYINNQSRHYGEFLITSVKSLSKQTNQPYQYFIKNINNKIQIIYNDQPITLLITKLPRQQFLYYQSKNKQRHNEKNYGKYKDYF